MYHNSDRFIYFSFVFLDFFCLGCVSIYHPLGPITTPGVLQQLLPHVRIGPLSLIFTTIPYNFNVADNQIFLSKLFKSVACFSLRLNLTSDQYNGIWSKASFCSHMWPWDNISFWSCSIFLSTRVWLANVCSQLSTSQSLDLLNL